MPMGLPRVAARCREVPILFRAAIPPGLSIAPEMGIPLAAPDPDDEPADTMPHSSGRTAAMKLTRLLACSLALSAAVALEPEVVAAQSPHTHQHSFSGAQRWAHVFDDPKRDAWQKPHEVIQALQLEPDAVIADLGSGTGYFTVRLATMVPEGRVYGVDVEPDMVKYLAERARREKRSNIVAIAGTPQDPRLPEKVDLILLVDVYHHIDAREQYFRQLRASLKPGGRIAVIDFRMDSPEGPPVAARIAPEQVVEELESAGYRLGRRHDFLPNQYFLIFEPRS